MPNHKKQLSKTDTLNWQQLEQTLPQSSMILRAIIKGTPDAIFVKNIQGQYILINAAGANIIGKPIAEIIGKTDADLLPSKSAQIVQQDDQAVINSGQVQMFEDVVTMAQSTRHFQWSKIPYRDDNGQIIGIIGISRDITNLKYSEFSQRLLAAAGDLLTTSLDYNDRLSKVARLAVPEMADWCSVDVLEEDNTVNNVALAHVNPEKIAWARNLQRQHIPFWNSLISITNVLRTGKSELYSEIKDELLQAAAHSSKHLRLIRELQIKSAMAVPLNARHRTLGVMTFVWTESERRYTQADLVLAEELARRAAMAVDNARLYEAERKARIEAEAAQQKLTTLAEIRERNRLAQELHDNIAQAIGYANLKTSMANMQLAQNQLDELETNLNELKQVIGETYTDIRGEIFNLRSEDTRVLDFLDTLNHYIEKYKRFYKLNIELVMEADQSDFEFEADVKAQIIRTIQEALINVRKHAQIDEAVIRLSKNTNGNLTIQVEDQGQGFDIESVVNKEGSYGLQIMRERAESIGGTLTLESNPGRGTRVILQYSR